MKCVDVVKSAGDNKIFCDDKINFLVGFLFCVRMFKGREAQNKINKVVVEFDNGFVCRHEKLSCGVTVDFVRLNYMTHVFLGWMVDIKPHCPLIMISCNHYR